MLRLNEKNQYKQLLITLAAIKRTCLREKVRETELWEIARNRFVRKLPLNNVSFEETKYLPYKASASFLLFLSMKLIF